MNQTFHSEVRPEDLSTQYHPYGQTTSSPETPSLFAGYVSPKGAARQGILNLSQSRRAIKQMKQNQRALNKRGKKTITDRNGLISLAVALFLIFAINASFRDPYGHGIFFSALDKPSQILDYIARVFDNPANPVPANEDANTMFVSVPAGPATMSGTPTEPASSLEGSLAASSTSRRPAPLGPSSDDKSVRKSDSASTSHRKSEAHKHAGD